MKDDVISRHGVSAWLDNMGYPRLADAIMDEKRFPSVQRWIPCSETVDIPDYEVLACDKYGGMIIGYLVYNEQWICESETELMYDSIAWMPLPQSYKEDGHD